MAPSDPTSEPADDGDVNSAEPDIFAFRDYREYLKNLCKYLKATTKYFSHRWFAGRAGFGSQSYFRMVMNGERDISSKAAGQFAQALNLNKRRTRYFTAMVLYNQARDEPDKDRYLGDMLGLLPPRHVIGIERDQLEYLTDSLNVIVREMVALPDFREDVEWIRSGLRRNVLPAEVRHALELLERLGLVVRDRQGRLRHSKQSLKTDPGAREIEILNYHRQILSESRDAIMTAPYDEWDIAAKTIPVPKILLPKVSEILHDSLDRITKLVNDGPDDYHEVYQINMQLFPLTMTKKPREFGWNKDEDGGKSPSGSGKGKTS